MKKPPTFFLAGLCAAGLLAGFAGRRIFSGKSPAGIPTTTAAANSPARSRDTAAFSPDSAKASFSQIPAARSTDTAESILTADPAKEYARIARWLATAGEQEIAGYWEAYKGGARTVPVTDLVFINWTRRNPQAAVAAVRGTADDRYAWWAWSANDPAAALAAVALAGPAQMEQVACGIGDFNPDWLRKHIDRIPGEFRDDALNRMRNWPDSRNPLESLKILKENGVDSDDRPFKSLVRKDPWAAFDWLKENPAPYDPYNKDRRIDVLVATLAAENPEDLEKLAAQAPAGETQRKMEQALFDHLLETDPAAALEQARATEAPLIAAQRLGQIGLGLVATDPGKAFEIAAEILAANPGKIDPVNRTEYENGSMWSMQGGKATDLMNALFAKDREKTVATIAAQPGAQNGFPETLATFTRKWAEEDLAGFVGWTNQQSGALQQEAARQIGYKLAGQGNYLEAIDWAKIATPDSRQAYTSVLYQWKRSDPQAAAAWLENSDLTNEDKAGYRAMLKDFPR